MSGISSSRWSSSAICASRAWAKGSSPLALQTCPTGAIKFGKYEDMLAEAHKRINDNPGKYIDHVYGEHENGGTATLLHFARAV